MDTNIANVKVWKKDGETRIYVRTVEGREGCRYLTGNRWHPAKTNEGTMTDADWKEARRIAYFDNKWNTVYESELHGTIFGKAVNVSTKFQSDEDVRNDIEAKNNFKPSAPAEPEIYG